MRIQLIRALLVALTISISAFGQSGIKGTIKSSSGDLLPFATIYIRNIETGTTSNDVGQYEYNLKPGKYDLVFQYLGYESQVKYVEVGAGFSEVNVQLKETALVLREVEVRAGKEDPAYTIMRKAIAKADYHRNHLDKYSCEVYIKGSGRLIDSPFFLRKAIAKEGVDSTTAFVSESISVVTYTRPNQYDERVISVRSIGEGNNTSPNGYIQGSFYESKIANAISPLSPKAFGYYKFEYLGTFMDRGYAVSKIRVIPRSKGDDLFAGTISIVEEAWSIYNVDLKTSYYGIIFEIKQIYDPIENKAWMPISHTFHVEGTFFGFEFEYDYLATASKYEITLNPDLEVEFSVIDEKVDKELAAKLEEQNKNIPDETFAKMASGKELTRKEMRKMIREYEKQEAARDTIPDTVEEITTFKIDSLAHKKDTSYWNTVRPVPLSEYEIKGYHKMDSMAVVEKQEAEGDTIKTKSRKRKGFQIEDIVIGNTYKIGDKTHFEIEPVIANVRFNAVEGYNFYYQMAFTKTFENKHWLEISPFVRYGFSRKEVTGKLRTAYAFGERRKRKSFVLEGGKYVSQINRDEPIHDVLNSLTALILKENYMKLYEDEYLQLAFRNRVSNEFNYSITSMYTKRLPLQNNTNHSWTKKSKDFESNTPVNAEMLDTSFDPHYAFLNEMKFNFKPWLKYKIHNKRKRTIDGSSPEISVVYENAIPVGDAKIDFHKVKAEFKHAVNLGIRGRLSFNIGGGAFLSKDSLSFLDYNHFMGNRTPIQMMDAAGSYRLLDYYLYSTKGAHFNVLTHYQFRKFFLSRFGFIQKRGIKESVIANYLYTQESDHFTELGYSIDNIFRVFRVEGVAAFQNGKYLDWGIRVGIAANLDQMFEFD